MFIAGKDTNVIVVQGKDHNEGTNSWKLEINRKESIREIAQKMYKNAPFCLERKHQRFIDWNLC